MKKELLKHLPHLLCGALFAAALCPQTSGGARLRGLPSVPQAEAYVAEAVAVEHAPKLDGTLDDPLWQSAKPIIDFRQREPHEGEAPTENTEVRILYTRHAVYFGIHCYDTDPSRIIATELR
jgi:hypothetical protein